MKQSMNGTGNHEEEGGGLDWASLLTTAKPYMLGAVAVITIGIKVIELHQLLHKAMDTDSEKEGR